ncbi:MAG: HAMP domain-containing sensor histidine kinase [Bacilli bacterium]|nr:HAMP domain-containing sensor histidine kinase [Bacilli bacterium]
MKTYTRNLPQQLLSIAITIFGVIFISLGLVLPKVLVPIYEKNIYRYLKEPLVLIQNNLDRDTLETDICYLYVVDGQDIIHSDNLNKIIGASAEQILKKIDHSYGKFKYYGKTYYYNTSYNDNIKRVAITGDGYIEQIKDDILFAILPTLFITFVLVMGLILLWSRKLVVKIGHLRDKIVNINNDDYVDTYNYEIDDEFKALSVAIDNMRNFLKENEQYKSQMYQNISHDFKTPLTVMKSYIEAVDDGVEDEKEAMKIIKEQIEKLQIKVHSLLYLNKLNYIQDSNKFLCERIDIVEVLKSSMENFKVQRPDIKWKITIADKKTLFRGNFDMWEAIIDNILNNFIRYADKEIHVTIKNNRITLYNDGTNIDENILDDIFTPYKKGIKGQFGLGLSIVRKTVALLGYEVTVKNEKKGISFIIK